jgi:hypothetical protein
LEQIGDAAMKLEHIQNKRMGKRYLDLWNADYDRDDCPHADSYVRISGYCGNINPNTFTAAPELLEALERLMSDIENGEYPYDHVGFARATIAKAKGE